MNKTVSIRISLLFSLGVAFMLFGPAKVMSQTASTNPVPARVATGSHRPAPPPAFISAKHSAIQGDAKSSSKSSSKDQPLSTQYDCGHPTNEEQYMLELINRARANPDSEGIRLKTTTDADILSSYSYFQSPTPAQVAQDFSTYPARPPLAFNADLINAARGHDNAMIKYDSQYHVGPDSDPFTRMNNAGYTGWSSAGENVFAFGDADIWYDDATFLIDFGNPSLGHRHNIMNFASDDGVYTEVGVGIVHGAGSGNPDGDVGPVLTTEDFGEKTQNFILGVVYSDLNGNDFYDMTEGDSGVKITVSSGSYYAVSSGSGGYAIPFSGSGTVTVTASGGVFPSPVTHTIDFEGENVKVDFTPDLTGFPTQVALVTPMADTVVNADTLDFVWDTMAIATKYHIEIATDSLMKNLLPKDNDSLLTSTSVIFGGFKDSTTYFWRVQAKNAKGLGGWSAVASFFVALPPGAVALVSPANAANVGDSNIDFEWRAANTDGYGYWLIVTSDKAMMDTVFQDNPQDTSDFVDVSAFPASPEYYWTVIAQNENGWSSQGAVRSFTTGTSSVAASNVVVAPIVVSPNPTAGPSHIRFTLSSDADVSLRIFNTLGEEVQSFALGNLSASEYDYALDFSKLPVGSYTYELRAGDKMETGRIVIMR